ncbi:hypothetical protein HCA89_00230 [Listeria innocua]|uniref:Uncharacterized protein n=1 Tax=Listeria innocua TaxID=1642 RepID=A0AB73H4B1_LISIO|nr:hypothetical protein [Listeria innocua]MBC2140719.1 hypothetical protein [Listeria innocua]
MSNFEEEICNILDDMHFEVEKALGDCNTRLIEISTKMTYKQIYSGLRSAVPLCSSEKYRVACHDEILKRINTRQSNEIFNNTKYDEKELRIENERLLKENEALGELVKSNLTAFESHREEGK